MRRSGYNMEEETWHIGRARSESHLFVGWLLQDAFFRYPGRPGLFQLPAMDHKEDFKRSSI
nr:hypothetical protein [Paenactinomyces guangxiensis]